MAIRSQNGYAILKSVLGALIAFFGLWSHGALGVGFGELKHQTFLGQPFVADIELFGVDDISVDQIRVRQLNEQQAAEANIDIYGASPRLSIELTERGNTVVGFSVQSRDAIVDPYLSLVFQVVWPEGTLVREYAVLLDAPPVRATSNVGAANSDNAASATSEAIPSVGGNNFQGDITERGSTQAYGSFGKVKRDRAVAESSERLTLGAEYTVRVGDTLSGIVSKVGLPNGVSWNDMIETIQANNPNAFINGNINSLKAGATLKLPSSVSINTGSYNAQEAPSVAIQETLAPKSNAPTRIDRLEKEGRLSLSEATEKLADGADYDIPQIREQIDGAQEMIDLLVKENQDLRERIDQIESSEYLTTLSELVSLQKQQIKELREQFRAQASGAVNEASQAQASGTSANAPVPIVRESEVSVRSLSLSQKLARNIWALFALVLLTFALIIIVGLVVMRRWLMQRKEQVAYTEYQSSVESKVGIDDFVGISNRAYVSADGNEIDIAKASGYNKVASAKPGPHADEKVKQSIRSKTANYDASKLQSDKPSVNKLDVEMVYALDEEVNELLSMAKIYCSAGKYSEARAILSTQDQTSLDPRLSDALQQINELEKQDS